MLQLLVRRRNFIALLAGATAWPLAADAQQTAKVPHIGLLNPGPPGPTSYLDAFYQGLHELGYTEGQNIVVERVDADFKSERFPELASELVRRKVDVIAVFSTSPARAVKEATSTIPIVVAAMADPVWDGLVASLVHPGGNLTGNTFVGPELIRKRLDLLKQAIPGLSRLAALWHPTAYGELTMAHMVKDTETAAQAVGVQLQLVPADGPGNFDSAFAAMSRERAEAVIILLSPMFNFERRRIAQLALKNRLPASYATREFVEAGGLMSYAANIDDIARRGASYVDKILKGASPADLPVELPTKYELFINLKTARELGLVISPALLAGADEVID